MAGANNVVETPEEEDIRPATSNENGSPSSETTTAHATGRKAKQKRRKPTLNCSECVERKTKCDRGRPSCIPCIRRQATCCYTHVANVLASSALLNRSEPDANGAQSGSSRLENNRNIDSLDLHSAYLGHDPQHMLQNGHNTFFRAQTNSFPSASLINRHSENTISRLTSLGMFGVGTRHPFNNYWTNSGGIPEVISVLPNKEQADLLVERYFESVDPIYPIIPRAEFRAEYERFWNLPIEEKNTYDAAQLALQFVIYGCGTRLVQVLTPDERVNTSNFYLSASHQCLCIHSYLNCFAITTVITAVLMCHFLIGGNNVSDAWTFSGMTQRQAIGLELHRDPDLISTHFTASEKQQRCKIWLCCMFQDASLSMFLSLPPTTIHYDIGPAYLNLGENIQDRENNSDISGIMNSHIDEDMSAIHDMNYLKALWEYVAFLQTYICVPKALDRPLATDETHKARLVSRFRQMYNSWSEPFNSYDPGRFEISDKRLLRQVVAISSVYFYVLTLLCMDKNESSEVDWDVYGALDAAHEGMAAFFALQRLDPGQIDSWGAYHTRAFAQAMMVGNILAAQPKSMSSSERDVRFMLAKSDFDRYIDILIRGRGTQDYEAIQLMRIADLQALRANITVA